MIKPSLLVPCFVAIAAFAAGCAPSAPTTAAAEAGTLGSASAVTRPAQRDPDWTATDPAAGDGTAGGTTAGESGASNRTEAGGGPSPEADAPPPRRVRIPSIGVDADIGPLGLRDDGSIEVPSDWDETGWWADGPEPGESGPAVVLGHVDSTSGPAVFHRLSELAPGDLVHIDREDGSTVTYRVSRLEQHGKDVFPSDSVYGRTDEPVLRLITCGGDFDRSERSYFDNVIVFADELVSIT